MSIAVYAGNSQGIEVQFRFEVSGVCPLNLTMAGTYHGICTVSYLPETVFVDVARLQAKYKEGNRLVAENLALVIYQDIVRTVGDEIPIAIDLVIEATSDHGSIRAMINPTFYDWKGNRKLL